MDSNSGTKWLLYAIPMVIAFAINTLAVTKLNGAKLPLFFVIWALFVFIGYLTLALCLREPFEMPQHAPIFLACAIISALSCVAGNWFFVKAIAIAPCSSFVVAMRGSEMIIVTVAVILLARIRFLEMPHLNWLPVGVGMALIWAGIVLVAFGKQTNHRHDQLDQSNQTSSTSISRRKKS